jgi:hypothetical protein
LSIIALMKERDDIEDKTGNINLSKFKFGGIPIGFFLEQATKVAPDQETHNGLKKARAAVKERGIIVLDTHHSRLDVFATGLNMLKVLDINNCVIPSSIKNLNHPIVKIFVDDLRKIKGMEIYPTFRIAGYVAEDERKMYENMPEEERIAKNDEYVKRAVEILHKPKSMVFVAVYGGFNRPHKGLIPSGIETILKTGNPALCTLSLYGKRFLPVTTYTSEDLLYFNENSLNKDMFIKITEEHKKIAGRMGFDKKYFGYQEV